MGRRNKGNYWRRYKWQKNKADQRGVPWRLTFDDWLDLWMESGKWAERGRRHGEYCMARYGDLGAYERGNVRICLVGENVVELTSRLPLRGFCAPGFQAARRAAERKAKAG